MQTVRQISDNALLRLRRRRLRKTRREMAEALGISERALAYYEQNRPVPKAIMLAVEALSGGISVEMRMGREQWVAAVDNLLHYGQGEPVVGRLLRERRLQALSDMLDLARHGPEAATAAYGSGIVPRTARRGDQGLPRRPSDVAGLHQREWRPDRGAVREKRNAG